MKTALLAAGLALAVPAFSGAAMADQSTLFAGVTYTFGKGPGATVKYLSTNDPNKIGVAAGATYNFGGGIGCDVGISAAENDFALTLSYDICMRSPQIGGGFLTNPQ